MSTPTAPQNFPRFPELPAELQMQVWSHAIGTFKLNAADLYFFEPANPCLSGHPEPHWFTPNDKASMTMRRVLLRTCRMAILVALEIWRWELREVSVPAISVESRSSFSRVKKDMALSNLEFLIAELKQRM